MSLQGGPPSLGKINGIVPNLVHQVDWSKLNIYFRPVILYRKLLNALPGMMIADEAHYC